MVRTGASAKFVAEVLVVLRLDGKKPKHRQQTLKIFVTTFIINSVGAILTPNMSGHMGGLQGYLGSDYQGILSLARQELQSAIAK